MKKFNRKFLTAIPISLFFSVMVGCGLSEDSGGSGDAEGEASSVGDSSEASVELKISHQWPQATTEEGDFRSVLAEKFAQQVQEKSDGEIAFSIYPSSSLVGAREQYDAMLNGSLDMSVFPLDYAGGKVPEFGITLMPALIRNHEQAQAWETSEIGQRIEEIAEEIAEENGMKILVWVWNAGAIGNSGDPIVRPEDVEDVTMRAAGARVEEMLRDAGASITSMASSEMYSAFQTGVLDAGITSNSSFASYNLQEQISSFTTSSENTFWFMGEPLVISMDAWEQLSEEQQQIFEETAEELQPWAYEASEEDDERVTELFKEEGLEVVDMSDEAYNEWLELAEPVWEEWAKNTDNGEELLELAKDVLEEN
ncbi:TRAP transporter substrate-binding protein DctP [Alteribacillus iranensis]|uniref:TRAP-type C4-dicarboxylate transport system, substrate-binding protein n=1 Tax=Alteribacillus iranensis TaxID=930128 RepID=A0A1I2E3C1_9BACI|nr:TRAP transporter substrate-binding protein DctP [Alteribacillus iranensis]SFE87143.1 TRAP-type C4-dicarboxylate transport system, substrate-binding protein [Alteribacillus iranensis]